MCMCICMRQWAWTNEQVNERTKLVFSVDPIEWMPVGDTKGKRQICSRWCPDIFFASENNGNCVLLCPAMGKFSVAVPIIVVTILAAVLPYTDHRPYKGSHPYTLTGRWTKGKTERKLSMPDVYHVYYIRLISMW